ncbi:hypothetical protein K432DRAFT_313659 [Lepidopterella palustris CBS 459.81]|uniref:Uncharacterized protein n=1 Tax=Lepidopterella palustris CBS 459.81 TaxID=1314670 RepID=A0A8E2DWR8_9PEZI|nr:hypothetical protein K432DRAFT_313659 [Lepidopterella palustris CBS 459.81]
MASESRNSHEDSAVPEKDSDQAQTPPSKFVVVKVHDPKGELTLYRLSSSTPFTCGRCNKEKKVKLVAIYQNQWAHLRCNACYGKLLSEH